MKLKPWQILALASIGLASLCLVCIAGSLVVSTLVPAPTEAFIIGLAPTIAPTLAPTATVPPSPIPPSPTLPPSATPTTAPTDTPIPSLTPGTLAPVAAVTSQPAGPACLPPNPVEVGAVVEVVDGDTIHVLMNGLVYGVRYIGIDTPETKDPNRPVQPFGPEAAARNAELVSGQQVVMVRDVSETDQYDRLLRYVFVGSLGGTFVNYELVRQGYASASTYPPDVACSEYFRQAEQEARQASAGLWGLPPLVPSLTPVGIGVGGRSGGIDIGPCDCSGPDLDCEYFGTHTKAQACFDFCRSNGFGDVFRLDSDNNGLACERLP